MLQCASAEQRRAILPASSAKEYRQILTASEKIGAAAAETESAPLTVPATSSSALLDARFWLELSPWRISAAWSLAAAALAAGIDDVSRTVSPQLLVLLFLLVDPLWGNIWGGLATPEALPRIKQTILHRRPWLPYLTLGSPAARMFGLHGPGVLSILTRSWLPSVLAAFMVAFVIGMPAVWVTLLVLGIAVSGWLQRHVALFSVSVLHSLVVVAAPWLLGLTLFGLDPWSGYHWALILLWTVHVWGGNRCLEAPDARSGLRGAVWAMGLAQTGIALLLIVGQAPLPLAVLSILWLATWLAIYRGRSLASVQASSTAALLVSAAAMTQTTF